MKEIYCYKDILNSIGLQKQVENLLNLQDRIKNVNNKEFKENFIALGKNLLEVFLPELEKRYQSLIGTKNEL